MIVDKAYLALSTLGLASTANGWRPFARHGWAAMPSFSSGLVTSELPRSVIVVQAAGTVVAARKGALRTKAGKAGLALNLASAAGLVGLHLDARQSAEVLEDALVEGLGPDYRARIVEPLLPETSAPGAPRHGPFQLLRARRRYKGYRDVSYGDAGKRNQLDVWRRRDLPDDGRAPVLIQVHGGAWVMGSKEAQALPLMSHLAERGWVCVAINYRLSPAATWPDEIVDVKKAIAWVKANIAAYGGDPDFIAITGGSAGGHLSSLAALTPGEPIFQPGFEDADTSVQAAVPFYGVYDFLNRDGTGSPDLLPFVEEKVFKAHLDDDPTPFDQASPMTWVGPDAPPFFALHGVNDSLAPIEQARAFVGLLRKEASHPVVFAELPHAQHAFESFDSVRAGHAVRAVDRFLGAVYGDYRRSS